MSMVVRLEPAWGRGAAGGSGRGALAAGTVVSGTVFVRAFVRRQGWERLDGDVGGVGFGTRARQRAEALALVISRHGQLLPCALSLLCGRHKRQPSHVPPLRA